MHKNFCLNDVNFKLSKKCARWFSLPEKDVYEFIDEMNEDDIFYDLGSCEG